MAVSPVIEDTEGDTEEEDESYTDYTYEGIYTPILPGREQESVPCSRTKSKLQNVTQTKPAHNSILRTHSHRGWWRKKYQEIQF